MYNICFFSLASSSSSSSSSSWWSWSSSSWWSWSSSWSPQTYKTVHPHSLLTTICNISKTPYIDKLSHPKQSWHLTSSNFYQFHFFQKLTSSFISSFYPHIDIDMPNPLRWVGFCKMTGLAGDGRCKTFDASADGFGRSEGSGAAPRWSIPGCLGSHGYPWDVSKKAHGKMVWYSLPT